MPSRPRPRRRPRTLAITLLALALALPACGKGKGKGDGSGGGGGGGGGNGRGRSTTTASAPAPVQVAIFVDDKQVATKADLGSAPRPLTDVVAGLPPIDAWLALELVDTAGKVHTTMAPAKNQPGKVPALATGSAGVELGFVAPGATGPLVDPVRGVWRVRVIAHGDAGQIAAQAAAQVAGDHGGGDSGGNREHAGEARPPVPADLSIAITGPAGDRTFTAADLEALPVIKAPSGDTETPGWSLVDLLAAAGVTKPQVVHLTDGEGATLQLGADDFDRTKAVLYLKLNRSGVIRFRAFRKTGATWDVTGELRGITKIHVVK